MVDCSLTSTSILGNRNASGALVSSDFLGWKLDFNSGRMPSGHRKYHHDVGSWMVALKIQRDSHDIKALSLISEKVAGDVRRLAEEFNLSIIEVLDQAVGLLERSGLEKQRTAVRTYWEALPPEERKARASRASRARWDAERAKKGQS